MTELGEAMWMLNALDKHKRGECMDLHKVFIIGRQAVAREKFAMFTFSNVWNLLNIYRAIGSGYSRGYIAQRLHDTCHSHPQEQWERHCVF